MHATFVIGVLAILIILMMSTRRRIEGFAPASKLCDSHFYKEIDGFLTSSECDNLIESARKIGMTESQVGDNSESHIDTAIRKSRQAWIEHSKDAIAQKILDKTKDLVGHCLNDRVDIEYELVQVVEYGVGGKYDPHFDGTECKETCPESQRVATLLIYLNDGFSGGHTVFPKLGGSVTPKKGKAILFWVGDPDTRDLFEETLHGGDPVTSGEKWIATQWVLVKTK